MKSASGKAHQTRDGAANSKQTLRDVDRAALLVWQGPEYHRIAPGLYTAPAVRIIPPQYLRRWQRWSVGICFRPFAEPDVEVVLFLNLGKDMKPKRESDFFRAWTLANGDFPKRQQQMDLNIFLEGQIYEIEVIDALVDSVGKKKSDEEVYSKVKRIASVVRSETGSRGVIPIKRN